METITKGKVKFHVSEEVLNKYPELVQLILGSESMDDDERQYWFDMIPAMTDEQIDRLFDILDTERRKFEELERQHQEEIKKIHEDSMIEWQQFYATKKAQIREEEKKDASDDPEEILKLLNNI